MAKFFIFSREVGSSTDASPFSTAADLQHLQHFHLHQRPQPQPDHAVFLPRPPRTRTHMSLTLSPHDEALFAKYLQRSKTALFTAKSKSGSTTTQLPLYFGTSEDEITPHRKAALKKRRDAAVAAAKEAAEKAAAKEAEAAASAAATAAASAASTPPPPPLSKIQGSMASNLRASKHASPSAAALRAKQPPPHTQTTTQTSTPSPSPPPPATTTTTPPNNTFDTLSPEFLSSQSKTSPLGITLLRLIFDSKYLNIIFNTQSTSSTNTHLHGLQNSGNICYMNSVLQILFHCQPFARMLNIIRDNTLRDLNPSKSSTPIMAALLDLQDLFKSPSSPSTPTRTINPDKFYTVIASLPRFSHLSWGRQEDAEEFLNILLDGLHEESVESIKSLSIAEVNSFANAFNNKETTRKIIQHVDFIKDSSKENASALDDGDGWNEVGANMKPIGKRTFQMKISPIVTLFGGQFKSVLKVSNNKKSSITLDPFMQVQLDISDPDTSTLLKAFEKFSQEEEISLGITSSAKKQNFIDKLPSILLIQLKRFSFVANDDSDHENAEYEVVTTKKGKKGSPKQQQQQQNQNQPKSKSKPKSFGIEKIHKFIKYDHNLTLPKSCISTMVSEQPNYKLCGVVYHHGRSTENGHYTADVLTSNSSLNNNNNNDDEWFRIDDVNITKITPADATADQNALSNINKSAYILMYRKV